MMKELKTGKEWQALPQYSDIVILDADGWRYDECLFDTTKITEEDFAKRKMMCTVILKTSKKD